MSRVAGGPPGGLDSHTVKSESSLDSADISAFFLKKSPFLLQVKGDLNPNLRSQDDRWAKLQVSTSVTRYVSVRSVQSLPLLQISSLEKTHLQ